MRARLVASSPMVAAHKPHEKDACEKTKEWGARSRYFEFRVWIVILFVRKKNCRRKINRFFPKHLNISTNCFYVRSFLKPPVKKTGENRHLIQKNHFRNVCLLLHLLKIDTVYLRSLMTLQIFTWVAKKNQETRAMFWMEEELESGGGKGLSRIIRSVIAKRNGKKRCGGCETWKGYPFTHIQIYTFDV